MTTQGNGETAGNGETVRTDFDALRSDFSALKTSVHQFLEGALADGKQRAKTAASAAGHSVADTAKSMMKTTETKIQARPFLSVLIVFLLGLVLGRLVLKA